MHESEKWKWSRSVVSDSSRPHGPQPTRPLRPRDFPGRSTGGGGIAFSCKVARLTWLLTTHPGAATEGIQQPASFKDWSRLPVVTFLQREPRELLQTFSRHGRGNDDKISASILCWLSGSHSKMYFRSFSYAFWAVCQMLQNSITKWKLKFYAPSYQLHTALVTFFVFPIVLCSCFDWQHLGLDFPLAENPHHSCFLFCDSEKVNLSRPPEGRVALVWLNFRVCHSPSPRGVVQRRASQTNLTNNSCETSLASLQSSLSFPAGSEPRRPPPRRENFLRMKLAERKAIWLLNPAILDQIYLHITQLQDPVKSWLMLIWVGLSVLWNENIPDYYINYFPPKCELMLQSSTGRVRELKIHRSVPIIPLFESYPVF